MYSKRFNKRFEIWTKRLITAQKINFLAYLFYAQTDRWKDLMINNTYPVNPSLSLHLKYSWISSSARSLLNTWTSVYSAIVAIPPSNFFWVCSLSWQRPLRGVYSYFHSSFSPISSHCGANCLTLRGNHLTQYNLT